MGFAASQSILRIRGDRAGEWSIRINEIVLGKRAVTGDTDLRPARYSGLSDGFFLQLQSDHDLLARRRQIGEKLKAIRPRRKAA